MSKDLLAGVNEVLKKTDVLDSDVGLLTTLTDSARQVFIDTAIQSLNEAVDELYSIAQISKPEQLKESTLTLVDGVQEHGLHSSLVMLRPEYGLIDETNNHSITILGEDGYWQQIIGDLDQDDTGLPTFCAINPTNGRLRFDRTPTSVEAGRIYKYRFDQDLELVDATDEFPFNNQVFRALVPAAHQWYAFHRNQEFSEGIYRHSMARAAKYLKKLPPRVSWAPRQGVANPTDPFHGP